MRGLHPLTRDGPTRTVKGMNSSRRQFLARTAVGAVVITGGSVVKPLAAIGTTPITALDQPDHAALDPALTKYLSADAVFSYDYALNNLYKANRPPEEIARQRQMWAWRQRFVGELFAHDVPILAGTDTGTPYSVPGFALHDELELLVGAGATPRQALYAATVEPARFLGMRADLGSVEPRKLADLVVLDADPLTDIRNTRRIHTVVTRGRVISPAARQRMLAEVEAAVKEHPTAATIAPGGCC